ncbi:MAG: SDR family oxidoreductase [Candidatus Hydrogenedens sp.]
MEFKKMLPLKGMNAIITGSAKRIGKHLSLRLAQEGINLALHYNSSDKDAKQLQKALENYPIKTTLIKQDLNITNAGEILFESAINKLGKIDIVINNASIFPEHDIKTFSYEDLITSINIHAWAPLQLSRCLYSQCEQGIIINILDTRLWDYDLRHSSYYLGKQLLRYITRTLAIEFAPKIRVNAIAPGLILPPPGETHEYLKKMSKTNPLQTFGNENDVSDAVVFLLKAKFITGQVIFIDGGRFLLGSVNDGII